MHRSCHWDVDRLHTDHSGTTGTTTTGGGTGTGTVVRVVAGAAIAEVVGATDVAEVDRDAVVEVGEIDVPVRTVLDGYTPGADVSTTVSIGVDIGVRSAPPHRYSIRHPRRPSR